MKNHFLISLCYRDFSIVTIRILKKFFFNAELQQRVISECLDIFIKMLQLLYLPDTEQECKDNTRDFLEVLHDGSHEHMEIGDDEEEHIGNSTQDLRNFVYEAIKSFAE